LVPILAFLDSDPDPLNQFNTDPIRIRIHNTVKKVMHC
jgi:hypothetical protein